jgi:uncharacterized Fe-S cluster protein YjdI
VAKTWYPVIDYTLCAECGRCVSKCAHDVFNKAKAPVPVVAEPDACVDHCHGCGNLCPSGAITYLGEDTGWVPPNGHSLLDENYGCCGGNNTVCTDSIASSCGCGTSADKTITIDYLYLDLSSCDRCIGTDQVLDEVVSALTPALQLAGYQVKYQKIEMTTAEIAKRHHFLSSPTIRVNGRDIETEVAENHCGCCSAISDSDVDCRMFVYEGDTYDVPPAAMLASGILHAVFGSQSSMQSSESYQLPANLKSFYSGKSRKECTCGGNCDV